MPCFIRQSWEAVCFATGVPAKREKIVRHVLRRVSEMDLRTSPPVMAQKIHRLIRKESGSDDPYREVKDRFNRLALKLYPGLRRQVEESADPFNTAVRIAIAGNIIDVGSLPDLNEHHVLQAVQCIANDPIGEEKIVLLHQAVRNANHILYLADNAGEIVFDKILIEQIGPEKTTVVVKAKPILNDATHEDAAAAGLSNIARVIDNGNDAPGTVLDDAPRSFRRLFDEVDLIIAKGQGNYETLGDVQRPIFFLLQAKCPVLAADIRCTVGASVVHHTVPATGKHQLERM